MDNVDLLCIELSLQPPIIRKQIVTLSRSRCFPAKGTRLYGICSDAMHALLSGPPWIVDTLIFVLTRPVLAGYLLSRMLAADYTREEAAEAFHQSVMKEYEVMNSVPRPPSIDFRDFLNDPYTPLHADIPFNPVLAEMVHRCIDLWITRISTVVIYPDSGSKTISAYSREDYFHYLSLEDDMRTLTTLNLEQMYRETGYMVEGPCELRQRWYPSNVSPRTYFAMGGTMYHRSKWCGRIFEELTQAFPPTEKRTRVRPDWISVDENEEVYIFDLTAFTSNMHEQRYFINALAERTRGIMVTVFDSHFGQLSLDLGSLLYQYAETCNQPVYRCSEKVWPGCPFDLVHSVAGFLGVYGNLMSCTFPHGVVNSMSGTRIDSSYTAGDDGGVATVLSEKVVHSSERTLGFLAEEKVYLLREAGALALKRPVYQFAGSIVSRRNVIWPSLCYLSSQYQWDLRFDKSLTFRDRKKSFSKALFSMMFSLADLDITIEERYFIPHILEPLYKAWGISTYGQFLGPSGSFPSIRTDDIGQNPFTVLLDRFPPVTYRIPADSSDFDNEDECFDVGDVFRSRMTKHISWMLKMGYVVSEVVEQEVLVRERFSDVLRYLMGKSRSPLYIITVLEHVPIALR